ncbi:HalOD1 output domain-containing protein [Salinilacihabitans rarus]|uniref:HalOD1 output domain-containing protein n=1 Tax=Salinilacihabitans rarus TaxID=2961596 RepID=UPI0020C89795|nr:HalOD1 output domain-containing protein [Salinilacihabitans rarus]
MTDRPSPDLKYDADAEAYVLVPSPEADVSVELVLAIAEITDRDPLEMRPIYECCDPETIDALCAARRNDAVEIDGDVSVTIADHRVTIEADGTFRVEPPA